MYLDEVDLTFVWTLQRGCMGPMFAQQVGCHSVMFFAQLNAAQCDDRRHWSRLVEPALAIDLPRPTLPCPVARAIATVNPNARVTRLACAFQRVDLLCAQGCC